MHEFLFSTSIFSNIKRYLLIDTTLVAFAHNLIYLSIKPVIIYPVKLSIAQLLPKKTKTINKSNVSKQKIEAK